jgi:hypothetical protein
MALRMEVLIMTRANTSVKCMIILPIDLKSISGLVRDRSGRFSSATIIKRKSLPRSKFFVIRNASTNRV